MFTLKPFQETAISQLKEKFLTLWKLGDHNLNLTFKSPTGSGKTIMMAQFLRDIVADPRFSHADVGFLWITNSDTLAMQSKDKLFSYYGGASENPLVDMNDLRDGLIPKNGVFFINWQKVVSKQRKIESFALKENQIPPLMSILKILIMQIEKLSLLSTRSISLLQLFLRVTSSRILSNQVLLLVYLLLLKIQDLLQ
jgi:hypothetical protein